MNVLNIFQEYLNQGGFVSVSLFILFLIITYTIGFRLAILFTSRNINPRIGYSRPDIFINTVFENYFSKISGVQTENNKEMERYFELYLSQFKQEISKFSNILMTAVLLAPLLGLLGTVIGMIETFSSLSSAELHSSSGGIAGGISQALITTQFGLLVAIPGVFISRYLKKLEQKTYLSALQLQDLVIENEGVLK